MDRVSTALLALLLQVWTMMTRYQGRKNRRWGRTEMCWCEQNRARWQRSSWMRLRGGLKRLILQPTLFFFFQQNSSLLIVCVAAVAPAWAFYAFSWCAAERNDRRREQGRYKIQSEARRACEAGRGALYPCSCYQAWQEDGEAPQEVEERVCRISCLC